MVTDMQTESQSKFILIARLRINFCYITFMAKYLQMVPEYNIKKTY